jgi:DNA-binding response OmpR family regulator
MTDRDETLDRARATMRRLQHEVRTPITQIMGYAELLEEELEERGASDLAPDLQKIRDSATRLLDLVDGKLREEHDPGAPVLPEPDATPSGAGEAGDSDGDRPARILVVDEDASARELLARRLERHGFAVVTARDGIEALRSIEAESPDLVLLEVMMSGMGGLEVLERLRRQRSRAELPIVLATALDDSQDAVEGLERGANDYVTKPFDLPVVIARIHSQLEAHRTARQLGELARKLEFRSTFIRQALGRDIGDDLLVAMAEHPDALDLSRERRRVAAVVADIRGSRQRAASLEPAQETAILRNVFDGLSAVVTRYGGVVEDISGDSLAALFGLPFEADDDAERAAACALAMQLEMEEINARAARVPLPAVEIGVGVSAGRVALVSLGTGDEVAYKAVGEPPLLAATIEAQAGGGEVWICPRTRERIADLARVDQERELTGPPRGADGPIRVSRLVGMGGSHLISLRSPPQD